MARLDINRKNCSGGQVRQASRLTIVGQPNERTRRGSEEPQSDTRCAGCTKATEARRGSSSEHGYLHGWPVVRRRALIRDRFRCVDCGWEPDIVVRYRHTGIDELLPIAAIFDELRLRKLGNDRHLHTDHIETIENAPELRLADHNIATRCNVCCPY
jgi:hypothetical protein